VLFHISSVLRNEDEGKQTLDHIKSDWFIFEELSRAKRNCNVRLCTVVSPVTVFLMAGPSRMAYDPQFDVEDDGLFNNFLEVNIFILTNSLNFRGPV